VAAVLVKVIDLIIVWVWWNGNYLIKFGSLALVDKIISGITSVMLKVVVVVVAITFITCFTNGATSQFLSTPQELLVETGEQIMLNCTYINGTGAVWRTANSMDLSSNPQYTVQIMTIDSVTQSIILIKPNAALSDDGIYTCIVFTITGTVISKHELEFKVIVESPPVVTLTPPLLVSQAGGLFHFSCIADGKPKPESIEWYYNGYPLTSPDDDRVFITYLPSASTLSAVIFSPLARSDNGTYHCSSSNYLASRNGTEVVTNSTEAIINILYSVEFQSFPVSPVTSVAGQTISISCSASANPPVDKIEWFHNGIPDNRSSHQADGYSMNSSLAISPVVTTDEGFYNCSASNINSSNYRIIELIVNYPPSVTTDDVGVTVNVTDTAVMTCLITGKPLPHVMWYFIDGTSNDSVTLNESSHDVHNLMLNNTTTSSSLTLHNITKGHEGSYRCTGVNNVQNLIGSMEYVTISLTVQVPPAIFPLNVTSHFDVLPNHTITFSFAIIESSPPPLIKWKLVKSDGEVIDLIKDVDNPHVILSPDRLSLTIVSLTTEYEGTYTLTAINPAGTTSATYSLNIGSVPLVRLSSDTLIAAVGAPLVGVKCDAWGDPLPNISWYFNGTKLVNSSRYSVMDYGNGSSLLSISHPDVSNDGLYTCSGGNVLGTAYKNFTLNIKVPSSVTVRPGPAVTVNASDSYTFTCSAVGNPPVMPKWYLNTFQEPLKNLTGVLEITSFVSNFSHKLYTSSSILYVSRIDRAWNGTLICDADNNITNYIGAPTHGAVNITVQVVPVLSLVGSDARIVLLSHSMTISFKIQEAFPPLTPGNVYWTFINSSGYITVIDSSSDSLLSRYVLSLDGLSLTVGNVTESDGGIYYITAVNDAGIGRANVTVDIEYPPKITSTSQVNALTNDNLTLSCNALGEPRPSIHWITPAASITNISTLDIKHVSINDSGVYTCVAVNEHGQDVLNITLNVQIPPEFIKSPLDGCRDEGDEITLSCSAFGQPIPGVRWHKDGVILAASNVTIVRDESSNVAWSFLTVNGLVYEDRGNYTCFGYNNMSSYISVISPPAQLIVNRPVNIVMIESASNVTRSQSTSFTCVAAGRPSPAITWFISSADGTTPIFHSTHFTSAHATTYDSSTHLYTTSSTLTLINATYQHSNQTIKCTAANSCDDGSNINTDHHSFHPLVVLIPPAISSINGSVVIGLVNHSISIYFIVDDRTYPSVTMETIAWSFSSASSDSIASPSVRVQLVTESLLQLVISDIRWNDEGNYTLVAFNEAGNDSITVHLDVEAVPSFQDSPVRLFGLQYSAVSFSCNIISEPLHDVTWKFNSSVVAMTTLDQPTDDGRKYTLIRDPTSTDYGTLIVANVSYGDEGNYTCVASNVHGIASHTTELILLILPQLVYIQLNTQPVIGATVTLKFKLLNEPYPPVTIADVYWRRETGKERYLIGGRYQHDISRNIIELTVSNVTINDVGTYILDIFTAAGNISVSSPPLIIHVPPLVYNASTCSLPVAALRIIKDQDDSLSIECTADGIPLPSIAWYRGRTALDKYERVSIEIYDNNDSTCREGVPAVRSILRITSLNQLDNGTYICEASNDHGIVTMETVVGVKPKYINYCEADPCENGGNCTNSLNSFICRCPDGYSGITCQEVSFNPSSPRIVDVSSDIYQSLSSNVTLRCIVSGYPQPDVTWYKDGVILEGVKSQLYHIEHLTLESRGLYQCKATNELGSDESDRFYVKIRGLIQYRADLTFNRQFIIQEILSDTSRNKRQNEYNFTATEENLNKIIDLINRETRNRLSSPGFTYFDMELLPTNITSLLQPISILLTLVSENINSDQIKYIITNTFANITQFLFESSMLSDPVNVTNVKRFDGCLFEMTTYPPPDVYNNNELDFPFEWVETDISQNLTLRCPCGPEGFDIGVVRNATRRCEGNFTFGAIWGEPDYTGCSNFTSNTRRLCNLALLDEADEILTGLDSLTSRAININSLDVAISTIFVEEALPEIIGNNTLSDIYLSIIDNLISANESSMVDSNEETKSSGRLLRSFEEVLNEYPLNNETATISLSQYTVILSNVSLDHNQTTLNVQDNIAFGLLDDFNASIYIPPSVLDNVTLSESSIKLVQTYIKNNAMFLRRRSLLETKGHLKVGSVLVSASMYNQSISGLTNNLINITFRMDQDIRMNARDLMCSYWEPKGDDNYGDWMIDGCGLLTNTTEYAVCGCNHLTTFALLMDVSPIPVTNPPGYNEFIMSTSYIGCIVSIICICALILTYSIERKLRSTTNGKLLLNLLIAFLGLYLSFISSVLLMSIIPLCIISSAVSQYFVLASCLAMAGEATVLYHKLVKVFSQVNERIVKMIFIVTWVLPIFIVIFTLAPNYQTYINSQFCRAVDYQFWIGYATPVVIILLYNAIMFVIIAFAVFKHQRTTTKNINGKLMTLLTISLLFGLNWVFAFASTQSLPVQWLRLSFQILFVLLGGFHGFYLFILYGLRLPKVRSVWLKWFYILTNQRDKANAVDKNMDKILFSQNSMRNSRLMKVFERTTSLNKQSKSNLDLPAEDVCNSKKQVNICTNDGSTHEKINNNTSSVTTDTNNNGNDDAANQPNSNDAGIGISEEKIDTVTDTMTDTISDYSSCYYSDLQPEPV
jgi:hypothetical protein